jgi:hypothetical protein
MVSTFDIFFVHSERLVHVRLSDPRRGTVSLSTGQRFNHVILDAVVTEARALQLSFDVWRDVIPCWQPDARRAHDSFWRSKVAVANVLRKLRSMEWLSNDEMNFLGSLPGNIPEDIAELYNADPRWPIRAMVGAVARRQEKLRQLEKSFGAAAGD